MTKTLKVLITVLVFGSALFTFSGCGTMAERQPVQPQIIKVTPVHKPVQYNYDHIIDPDPNYTGLGGGSLNLPGVERHDIQQ
jgi:hypothetical protein